MCFLTAKGHLGFDSSLRNSTMSRGGGGLAAYSLVLLRIPYTSRPLLSLRTVPSFVGSLTEIVLLENPGTNILNGCSGMSGLSVSAKQSLAPAIHHGPAITSSPSWLRYVSGSAGMAIGYRSMIRHWVASGTRRSKNRVGQHLPCTPDGDHLDYYVRAAQQGRIARQTLKGAVLRVRRCRRALAWGRTSSVSGCRSGAFG